MKIALFLDSANVEDARRAIALGFVGGITTNPAIIAQVRRPGLDVLRDMLDITNGPVFYQVTAESVEERAAQAREAAGFAPDRVFVKIPATTENLTLTTNLSAEGIQCAVTAISHPSQAYLSALSGASYTIPYVNRLTRQLGDGIAILRDCATIVKSHPTKVLAASLKSVDEVIAAVLAGADDVTIPLDLILALGNHELSQKAIDDFAAAMKNTGGA
ncbi:MAG: transaldolase [Chloroflexi bacterium]|nr:transaldolase [Chloroflexota bacterium]